MGCCSEWRSFKSRWQQNCDSFMARKLLGQPLLTLGISPKFTATLLKRALFATMEGILRRKRLVSHCCPAELPQYRVRLPVPGSG